MSRNLHEKHVMDVLPHVWTPKGTSGSGPVQHKRLRHRRGTSATSEVLGSHTSSGHAPAAQGERERWVTSDLLFLFETMQTPGPQGDLAATSLYRKWYLCDLCVFADLARHVALKQRSCQQCLLLCLVMQKKRPTELQRSFPQIRQVMRLLRPSGAVKDTKGVV